MLAWLEAGLDGHLEAPRPAPSSELEQRLAAVEARLDAIAAHPLAQYGRADESRPSERSSTYGETQAYLLRRLARDAPRAQHIAPGHDEERKPR